MKRILTSLIKMQDAFFMMHFPDDFILLVHRSKRKLYKFIDWPDSDGMMSNMD